MLRIGRLSEAEVAARSQAGRVARGLSPTAVNVQGVWIERAKIRAETRGLPMLRSRSGHARERSVKPLSWTNPRSSRPGRDQRFGLSQVSWRTSVAHQSPEDTSTSVYLRLPPSRCRIEPYLDQGGALRAPLARSCQALRWRARPARRAASASWQRSIHLIGPGNCCAGPGNNPPPVARGAAAPDPACMAPVAPLFHPLLSYADAAGVPCTQSQRRPPKQPAAGGRSRTWQLSGSGEKCAPPSPAHGVWKSPGTCQERLRRPFGIGYAAT